MTLTPRLSFREAVDMEAEAGVCWRLKRVGIAARTSSEAIGDS